MKTAFITDWLDKYGGAERVVTAINEIYDFDHYYAYVNRMHPAVQRQTFAGRDVEVTESRILANFKKYFRALMPFFPGIAKDFNKQTQHNKVDLVISSSWVLSKAYRAGDEVHICYLQARNFKYVWDEADLYFKGILKPLSFLKGYLQQFDRATAMNPQYLIANSIFVQNWVKATYGRESTVIYPPVDVEDFTIATECKDYYITVGRHEPYKRFDIVVEAFTKNKKPLIVVGDGTQNSYLRSIAGPNVTFTGYLSKTEVRAHLAKAAAFVYAGVEDFGIAIVEAHATGVPAIVYNGGASAEIIQPVNGVCFDEQTAESLNKSIELFENRKGTYSKSVIRDTALKFSKERFKKEFEQFVEDVKGTIK